MDLPEQEPFKAEYSQKEAEVMSFISGGFLHEVWIGKRLIINDIWIELPKRAI